MRIQAMCIALCAMAPMAASADGNRIEVHYTPMASFGDDEAAAKGDGFGARANVESGALLLGFEYSTADYPLFDEDIDQLRLSVGGKAGDFASFHVQYLKWDIFGTDADGFGGHVQLGQPSARDGGGYLRLGYLSLETDDFGGIGIDGFEYAAGATFPLGGAVQALLEFRSSLLEDEDGFKLYLEDLHLGISVPFGN